MSGADRVGEELQLLLGAKIGYYSGIFVRNIIHSKPPTASDCFVLASID